MPPWDQAVRPSSSVPRVSGASRTGAAATVGRGDVVVPVERPGRLSVA
ncbi:hypothetical protein [Micrococcus sp.]|nr:hypothetical protein [Micrococcus sp.]MDY6055960.1 hypothetical protein [Micrococcus sp.]